MLSGHVCHFVRIVLIFLYSILESLYPKSKCKPSYPLSDLHWICWLSMSREFRKIAFTSFVQPLQLTRLLSTEVTGSTHYVIVGLRTVRAPKVVSIELNINIHRYMFSRSDFHLLDFVSSFYSWTQHFLLTGNLLILDKALI